MTNSCLNCALAEWHKTKAGRLHPSGDGKCLWKVPSIPIPAAFYFPGYGSMKKIQQPNGGWISRKSPHENCPTFEGREVEE